MLIQATPVAPDSPAVPETQATPAHPDHRDHPAHPESQAEMVPVETQAVQPSPHQTFPETLDFPESPDHKVSHTYLLSTR